MAEGNVELHRGAVEAFSRRDIDAFLAYCDPSIEFNSVLAAVGGGTYRGRDGVRRWVEDLEDAWGGDFRVVPEAYFDLGEHTLGWLVLRGRGRHSGADVEMPAAHVARWRDGLCVYLKAYARRDDALRDMGVSEDALQAIAP